MPETLASCLCTNGNVDLKHLYSLPGMDDEAKISFEEHVFLDHLIEDEEVFPEGPIKHFMDLVCTGLSKNPYITVERKHKCIEWYRDYFTAKKAIIQAAAAE